MQRTFLFPFWLLIGMVVSATAQVDFTEFAVSNATAGASGLHCCDLDDDGDQDILIAVSENHFFAWFRNDGGDPVQWTRFTIQLGMSGAHSVHANDIDNDGDLDVIGSTYGSAIYWFSNEGGDPTEWTLNTITSTFTEAHEIYSTDIDGDGDIDVVGASSGKDKVNLWYNEGGDPITWRVEEIDVSAEMAKSVAVADFNGDGTLDVVSAALESGDIYWYSNAGQPDPGWEARSVDLFFDGAHHVHPVDLDEDGDMDIVGSGYLNSRVAWYANNGENPPSFSRQLISTSSINACVSKTADFDGNGFLDVAASEQGKNTVAVFFNDGATPFNWTRQDLSNNFVRPWPLDIADLDGDGDPDIVSASSYDGSNKVHWWRNERSLSVPDASILPDRSVLLANYPNPFNSSTRIFYQLPDAAAVEIGIYNMLGQQIRSYPMGTQVAGGHEVHWDGMTKAQVEAVSGVYTVVLRVDDLVESQRIVLIR